MSFDKLNADEPKESWKDHDIILWNAFKIKALEEKLIARVDSVDEKLSNHITGVRFGLKIAFGSLITILSIVMGIVLAIIQS